MHTSPRRFALAGLLVAACGGEAGSTPTAAPAEAADTMPHLSDRAFVRPLPTVDERVLVLPDQLDQNMTDAQVKFAATHFVGSQKLIDRASRRLRAVNPGFVVLQYRLATGLSTTDIITDRDTWARDTIEPDDPGHVGDPRRTREAFYLHDPPTGGARVAHADSYFQADVRNEAWQTAHIDEMLRRMPLNDFDGIFLDTAHLRTDGFTPGDWWVRFCEPDITHLPKCWGPPSLQYFQRLTERFHAGSRKYYAIGNFGPLVTGWDDNAYLAPLDGGMVELFMWLGGAALNEADWHHSATRILRLLGNDRVMIAEPVGYPAGDRAARTWILGNFLLLQGRRSYAAFYPSGTEATGAPVWLPEYTVSLGRPAAPLPASPAALCTGKATARACSGVYTRAFTRGFVAVNPAGEPRTATLPEPAAGAHWVALAFTGGGYVGPDGRAPEGRIEETPVTETTVTLPPSSAAIFQQVGR